MKFSTAIFMLLAFAPVAHAQIAPPSSPPMNGLPGQPAGPLQVDGRIPDAQLPASAFQYKGTWNAATNAPPLANGTGTVGDTYAISVSGTQNLGGGSISYTAGNLLLYNGTTYDQISESVPVPANPTASIGTSAVNGSASTFMRSDAAPAIDLTMSPTWTGTHSFQNGLTAKGSVGVGISGSGAVAGPTNSGIELGASPNWGTVTWYDADNTANNRVADTFWNAGTLAFRFKNDAEGSATTWLSGSGGYASGITGITSNSGSGSWVHTGPFNVNGFNGIAFAPSADGGVPSITTIGGNANVSLNIGTKGSGGISLNSNTSVTGTLGVSSDASVGGSLTVSPSGASQLAVSGSDIAAGATYVPTNPQSLVTKQYVDGTAYLPAATAAPTGGLAISKTTMYTAPVAGLYQISMYLQVTSPGCTGDINATLYWTDDTGVERTVVSPTISVAGLNATSVSQVAWIGAGQSLAYSTYIFNNATCQRTWRANIAAQKIM